MKIFRILSVPVLLLLFTSIAGAVTIDDQLFKALYQEDQSAVKILVEKGANVNAVGNYGWTPLMVATSKHLYEAAELLIKHGADVNARNVGGVTPLMWSVDRREISSDTIKIVRLLLANGADVNAKTKRGRTALSWVKEYNHEEIVRILNEAGARE